MFHDISNPTVQTVIRESSQADDLSLFNGIVHFLDGAPESDTPPSIAPKIVAMSN